MTDTIWSDLTPDLVLEEKYNTNVLVSSGRRSKQRRLKRQGTKSSFACSFLNRTKAEYLVAKAHFDSMCGGFQEWTWKNPMNDTRYDVYFSNDAFEVEWLTANTCTFEFSLEEM